MLRFLKGLLLPKRSIMVAATSVASSMISVGLLILTPDGWKRVLFTALQALLAKCGVEVPELPPEANSPWVGIALVVLGFMVMGALITVLGLWLIRAIMGRLKGAWVIIRIPADSDLTDSEADEALKTAIQTGRIFDSGHDSETCLRGLITEGMTSPSGDGPTMANNQSPSSGQ